MASAAECACVRACVVRASVRVRARACVRAQGLVLTELVVRSVHVMIVVMDEGQWTKANE